MSIQKISDEFIESYNKIYEDLKKEGQEKLKEVFKLFWEANPNVNVITWTQYTPYFNDGDTCHFSINEITVSNLSDKSQFNLLSWGEYDGDDETIWAKLMHELVMGKELQNFMYSNAMREILEMIFGDHCVIYATREGFYSEPHDHE